MCAWAFVGNYDGLPRESGTNLLAFRFCVRILRFLLAKILGFFLWLNAKKLKRQFVSRACSAPQIFFPMKGKDESKISISRCLQIKLYERDLYLIQNSETVMGGAGKGNDLPLDVFADLHKKKKSVFTCEN